MSGIAIFDWDEFGFRALGDLASLNDGSLDHRFLDVLREQAGYQILEESWLRIPGRSHESQFTAVSAIDFEAVDANDVKKCLEAEKMALAVLPEWRNTEEKNKTLEAVDDEELPWKKLYLLSSLFFATPDPGDFPRLTATSLESPKHE